MRIPTPSVGLQTGSSGGYDAPGVPAVPDVAGPQITQLGGAMASAGGAVHSVAMVLQDEVDDARVKEGYTRFAETASNAMYHPTEGYLHRVGQDAVGKKREESLSLLEKKAQEIEASLENKTQRGMFREGVQKHMIGVRARAYGHEAEQMRTWNLGQSRAMAIQAERSAIEAWMGKPAGPDATVTAAAAEARAIGIGIGPDAVGPAPADRAATDPQGPQGPGGPIGPPEPKSWAKVRTAEFDLHKQTAVSQRHQEADLMGLGPKDPQRALMVQETTTRIHAGIVDRLLDAGRTKEAKSYVADVPAGEISPEVAGKVERALREAGISDQALTVANEVLDGLRKVTTTVKSPDGDVDLEITTWEEQMRRKNNPGTPDIGAAPPNTTTMLREASAELRRRFEAGEIDARVYGGALEKVREQHAIMVSEWNDTARVTLVAAEKFFAENRNVTSVDSPSFPRKLREQLVDYGHLDSARRVAANNGVRVTDPQTYRQMLEDYESGAFDGMSQVALFNRYYASLGPTEWNEAQSLLAATNKVREFKAPPDDSVYSVQDQILESALKGGIVSTRTADGRPKPRNDSEAELLVQYRAEVQKRINVDQGNLKRELTTDEKVAIAEAVALDKQFEPRFDLGVDWLDSDELVHAWRPGVVQSDLYLEVDGEYIKPSSIPGDRVDMFHDEYRLGMLNKDQRSAAAKRLMDIRSAKGDGARTAINDMWRELGLLHKRPTQQQLVEMEAAHRRSKR